MKAKIKNALLKAIKDLADAPKNASRQAIWIRADRIDGIQRAADELLMAGCLPVEALKEISAARTAATDLLNAAAANAHNATAV